MSRHRPSPLRPCRQHLVRGLPRAERAQAGPPSGLQMLRIMGCGLLGGLVGVLIEALEPGRARR